MAEKSGVGGDSRAWELRKGSEEKQGMFLEREKNQSSDGRGFREASWRLFGGDQRVQLTWEEKLAGEKRKTEESHAVDFQGFA